MIRNWRYHLQRAFCLEPWDALDLWLRWRCDTDPGFAAAYEQQGSIIGDRDFADEYYHCPHQTPAFLYVIARPVIWLRMQAIAVLQFLQESTL